MDTAVVVAIIAGVFGLATGVVGRAQYDKQRYSANGNGGNGTRVVEEVLARREETRFQAEMKLLMTELTRAIEKGYDRSSVQLERAGHAIEKAANAINDVHDEIVEHRQAVAPVLEMAKHTHALVQSIHHATRKDGAA